MIVAYYLMIVVLKFLLIITRKKEIAGREPDSVNIFIHRYCGINNYLNPFIRCYQKRKVSSRCLIFLRVKYAALLTGLFDPAEEK